jgi:hypothetical protein
MLERDPDVVAARQNACEKYRDMPVSGIAAHRMS